MSLLIFGFRIMKINKAFTLAEILITITIIGLVAALVIPSLWAQIEQIQLINAWKQAYSMMDQANKRLLIDNGGSLINAFTGSSNQALNLYTQYFSVAKICYAGSSYGNCWHDVSAGKQLALNGSVFTPSDWGPDAAITLNDGMLVFFWYPTSETGPTCSGSSDGYNNICTDISIDVNGFKGPNTLGKDIFDVHVLPDRLIPFGIITNCSGRGWACSATYLKQ